MDLIGMLWLHLPPGEKAQHLVSSGCWVTNKIANVCIICCCHAAHGWQFGFDKLMLEPKRLLSHCSEHGNHSRNSKAGPLHHGYAASWNSYKSNQKNIDSIASCSLSSGQDWVRVLTAIENKIMLLLLWGPLSSWRSVRLQQRRYSKGCEVWGRQWFPHPLCVILCGDIQGPSQAWIAGSQIAFVWPMSQSGCQTLSRLWSLMDPKWLPNAEFTLGTSMSAHISTRLDFPGKKNLKAISLA